MGIIGSLTVTAAVCTAHDIGSGKIKIWLDGQQAMINSAGSWPLSPTQPDFDLLKEIRLRAQQLPIEVTFGWVEGHQDKEISFEELDPIAQDNVYVDNIAKAFLNRLLDQGQVAQPANVSSRGWSFSVNGEHHSCLNQAQIYEHATAFAAEEYWTEKFKWTHQIFVDWDLVGEALKSLSIPKKRRTVKWATGHLGVGIKLKLWKFQTHSNCPLCDREDEDALHVIQCQDRRARKRWRNALKHLREWCQSKGTHPGLTDVIISYLRSWQSQSPFRDVDDITIHRIVVRQSKIGWHAFFAGIHDPLWAETQHQYFLWQKKRNTGRRWNIELIKKLWEVSWDMWEHRNRILHNTVTPEGQRSLTLLNQDIQEELDTGYAEILSSDQYRFTEKINILLASTDVLVKQRWLASVSLARERYILHHEVEHNNLQPERTNFEQWLGFTGNPAANANDNPTHATDE